MSPVRKASAAGCSASRNGFSGRTATVTATAATIAPMSARSTRVARPSQGTNRRHDPRLRRGAAAGTQGSETAIRG